MNIDPALDRILKDSLRNALATDSTGADWEISTVSSGNVAKTAQFSMLTISSYQFKAITLLHFNRNTELQQYVKECLNIQSEDLPDNRFYDYINELANNFSGLLKRILFELHNSLGMSTPNILDGCCSEFMNANGEAGKAYIKAKSHGKTLFYASFYLFTTTDLDLSPIANWQPHQDETVSGELEFF